MKFPSGSDSVHAISMKKVLAFVPVTLQQRSFDFIFPAGGQPARGMVFNLSLIHI